MSSEADITVLATGGTIDKIYSVAGQFEVGPPAAQRLLDVVATDLRVDVRSVLAKDSLHMTDADRRALADALDNVDTPSVVITHGTDTLTVTAEYLSQHPSASGTARATAARRRAQRAVRRLGRAPRAAARASPRTSGSAPDAAAPAALPRYRAQPAGGRDPTGPASRLTDTPTPPLPGVTRPRPHRPIP
jgi:hypothetical protein